MSEIDWNTPVVDRTLTTNETQLLPQQVQAIAAGTTVSGIPSANHFVYFAAFDGTNNNRDNLSLAGDAQETNIGILERSISREGEGTSGLATQYFPGPGTELSRINSDWAPPKVTAEVVDIAQRAYIDYAEKAQAWLQSPNPKNEVGDSQRGQSHLTF